MKNAVTLLTALMAMFLLPGLSGCSKSEAPQASVQKQTQADRPIFPEAFHPQGWKHSLELDLGRCTEKGEDNVEISLINKDEYFLNCISSYRKGQQKYVAFVDQSGSAKLVPVAKTTVAERVGTEGVTADGTILVGGARLTTDGHWGAMVTAKNPSAIKNLPLSISRKNPGCSGDTPKFIGLDGYYYSAGEASKADEDGTTGGLGLGNVICRYKEGGEVEYFAGSYQPLPFRATSWKQYCPDEASAKEACFDGIGHLVATPDGTVYVVDGSLSDQEAEPDESYARVRKIVNGRVNTVLRIRNFELLAANRNNEVVVVRALQQKPGIVEKELPMEYAVVKTMPDGKVLSEQRLPFSNTRIDLAPSADGHVYVYTVTQTGPTNRRYDITRID